MKRVILSGLLSLAASTASAATVTLGFDDVDDEGLNIESGFFFDYSSVYNDGTELLFTDDSGLTTSTIRSTTGKRFDASSLDLRGFTKFYVAPPTSFDPAIEDDYEWLNRSVELSYLNFSITGVRNGREVVSLLSNIDQPSQTTTLGNQFRNLDKLVLALAGPPIGTFLYEFGQLPAPGQFYCDEWCTDVGVDNLVLHERDPAIAAVPLSASMSFLMTSFAALGFVAFRRRRSGTA